MQIEKNKRVFARSLKRFGYINAIGFGGSVVVLSTEPESEQALIVGLRTFVVAVDDIENVQEF